MENEKPQEKPKTDVQKWFEDLDRFNSEPFLPERNQPFTSKREIFE
jgi:hypothetical protein